MSSKADKPPVVRKFVVGALSTNCYLIHEEGSRKGALIDPGDHDPRIAQYMRDRNIDMSFILNTHGHADHILGNASFNLPILIHELDEKCLRPMHASRLLTGGETLKLGNIELEVIHTPGHTAGSVSVKCGMLLFSGDTLFFEGAGRTDLPGGSRETLLKSIKEKLFVLPDPVRVLPGHGPETTIGHERGIKP